MTDTEKVSFNPERLDGETFEQYKLRRKLIAVSIKSYLRGRPVWRSEKNGKGVTYVKANDERTHD